MGGAVASWLVPSSLERAVWVWALAGDTVLCSWARHLTLSVPLSTQEYKWVPANCWGKPNKLRGNDLRWTSILSRGSRNTPSRFMLQKPGISSGSYGPLGSKGLIFDFGSKKVPEKYYGQMCILIHTSCCLDLQHRDITGNYLDFTMVKNIRNK